jgi:uncharacterized protein
MSSFPKIDMHQHASSKSYLPDGTPVPNAVTGKPAIATTDEEVLHLTLEYMDKNNIEKSIITSSLKNVYRWMDYAPDKFIPGICMTTTMMGEPYPDPEMLRGEIKAGKIKVMGEIAAMYDGVPPNDPVLEPYYTLAEEMDIPVLIHCCGTYAPGSNAYSRHGRPLLLEDVLKKHPNLRIQVENAGYPFLDEMTILMMMYPNVYCDVSTFTWVTPSEAFYDYLGRLVKAAMLGYGLPIVKRVMFGSDQMEWPETIDLAVERIENAPFLTESQKKDIFYNNAKRFLRL